VQLLPCQPLALVPVNVHKPKIGENRTLKWLQRITLGLPGGDYCKWKLPFSIFLGHSASVLRDSAVYSKNVFFLNMTPHGISGTFARLKSRLSYMVGKRA
jgi:hypothetical protein